MKKSVLVLSTSLRPHSNSHLLAQKFAQGAQEAGHQVELISLQGKDICFCRGCLRYKEARNFACLLVSSQRSRCSIAFPVFCSRKLQNPSAVPPLSWLFW